MEPHGGESVVCVACGATVDRGDAREYDPLGDRWNREDKQFEHLCKPCHDRECHQPRQGLEDRLVAIGADHADNQTFIAAYYHSLSPSDRQDTD